MLFSWRNYHKWWEKWIFSWKNRNFALKIWEIWFQKTKTRLQNHETRFQNYETRFQNTETGKYRISFARTWKDFAQKKPELKPIDLRLDMWPLKGCYKQTWCPLRALVLTQKIYEVRPVCRTRYCGSTWTLTKKADCVFVKSTLVFNDPSSWGCCPSKMCSLSIPELCRWTGTLS